MPYIGQTVEEGRITVNGLEVWEIFLLHPHGVNDKETVLSVEEIKKKDIFRMGIADGNLEVLDVNTPIINDRVRTIK
jgi:hypothetical protein